MEIMVTIKSINGKKSESRYQKAIDPDLIEYTKPRLAECEIHMIDGTHYLVVEEYEEIKKRINKSKL